MRKCLIRVILANVLLLAGCQTDRLTRANFSQVRQHSSTEAEVIAELGEPEHRMPGLWIYQRPEQHLYVKVEFDDSGRVTRKEWIDGVTGNWEDSADRPAGRP